jgi:hypothetical protein
MATAQPVPEPDQVAHSGVSQTAIAQTAVAHVEMAQDVVEAAPAELNQWKRGFTPQAEIWNGRMAMLGLSVGLSVLLIARLAGRA